MTISTRDRLLVSVEQSAFSTRLVSSVCLILVDFSLDVILAADCLLSQVLASRKAVLVSHHRCVALPGHGLVHRVSRSAFVALVKVVQRHIIFVASIDCFHCWQVICGSNRHILQARLTMIVHVRTALAVEISLNGLVDHEYLLQTLLVLNVELNTVHINSLGLLLSDNDRLLDLPASSRVASRSGYLLGAYINHSR